MKSGSWRGFLGRIRCCGVCGIPSRRHCSWGVSAAARGQAAKGNGTGWVRDGSWTLFPVTGGCSSRVMLEALVCVGQCYGSVAKLGRSLGLGGHLTILSSKPLVLGSQPQPSQRAWGHFPAPWGPGGGTQSPQQHPRPRGGGVLFPEQGEGGRGRRREEVMQIPAQLKEDDFISFSSPGAIYSHFNLLPFALLSLQQAVSPQTAGCLYSPCSTEF